MRWPSGVLFAVEDSVAAILAVVTAAVGAGGSWVLNWLTSRRKTVLDEYQVIIERLQKQVDRCQSQVDEQQKAIARMAQLHADCRAESQEQYGFICLLHGIARRMADGLKKANVPCDDVPDLPPRPQRHSDEEIEYLRRATKHNTDIAKEARALEDSADRRRPGESGAPR